MKINKTTIMIFSISVLLTVCIDARMRVSDLNKRIYQQQQIESLAVEVAKYE